MARSQYRAVKRQFSNYRVWVPEDCSKNIEHDPLVGGLDTVDPIDEEGVGTDSGYLDKQGTPYGENARFNHMPPGMDISNQDMAEIHQMPIKFLLDPNGYGDSPWPLHDTVE